MSRVGEMSQQAAQITHDQRLANCKGQFRKPDAHQRQPNNHPSAEYNYLIFKNTYLMMMTSIGVVIGSRVFHAKFRITRYRLPEWTGSEI